MNNLSTLVNLAITRSGMENKGSAINQARYAGAQSKHFLVDNFKNTALLGTGIALTGASTYGVAKSQTAQNLITKAAQKVTNSNIGKKAISNLDKLKTSDIVQKATTFVKNMPGPAKAVAAAGTILTGLVARTQMDKFHIRTGQIDQEYTDKAQLGA